MEPRVVAMLNLLNEQRDQNFGKLLQAVGDLAQLREDFAKAIKERDEARAELEREKNRLAE